MQSFCLNSWDCFTQMFAFSTGLDSDASYWFWGLAETTPSLETAQPKCLLAALELNLYSQLILLAISHPFTSREPADR